MDGMPIWCRKPWNSGKLRLYDCILYLFFQPRGREKYRA